MTTNKTEAKPARKVGGRQSAADNVVELPQSKARDGAQAVTRIARDHPVAAVVGGLALGLLVGTVIRKGAFGKLARSATALAEVATLAGAALGREAIDKAEAAGSASKEFGRNARDRAASVGGDLLRRGDNLAGRAGDLLDPVEKAASNAIEAGHRFVEKAVGLVNRQH